MDKPTEKPILPANIKVADASEQSLAAALSRVCDSLDCTKVQAHDCTDCPFSTVEKFLKALL